MTSRGCPRCGSSFGGVRVGVSDGTELCPQCAPYSETSPDVQVDFPEDVESVAVDPRIVEGAETVMIPRERIAGSVDAESQVVRSPAPSSTTILAKSSAPEAPVFETVEPDPTIHATLTWEEAPEGEAPVRLAGGSTLVGSEGASLQLENCELAPQHFRIEARGNEFFLHDHGGSSGTFLNGYRVRAVKLMSGDRITAGSATFSFSVR